MENLKQVREALKRVPNKPEFKSGNLLNIFDVLEEEVFEYVRNLQAVLDEAGVTLRSDRLSLLYFMGMICAGGDDSNPQKNADLKYLEGKPSLPEMGAFISGYSRAFATKKGRSTGSKGLISGFGSHLKKFEGDQKTNLAQDLCQRGIRHVVLLQTPSSSSKRLSSVRVVTFDGDGSVHIRLSWSRHDDVKRVVVACAYMWAKQCLAADSAQCMALEGDGRQDVLDALGVDANQVLSLDADFFQKVSDVVLECSVEYRATHRALGFVFTPKEGVDRSVKVLNRYGSKPFGSIFYRLLGYGLFIDYPHITTPHEVAKVRRFDPFPVFDEGSFQYDVAYIPYDARKRIYSGMLAAGLAVAGLVWAGFLFAGFG